MIAATLLAVATLVTDLYPDSAHVVTFPDSSIAVMHPHESGTLYFEAERGPVEIAKVGVDSLWQMVIDVGTNHVAHPMILEELPWPQAWTEEDWCAGQLKQVQVGTAGNGSLSILFGVPLPERVIRAWWAWGENEVAIIKRIDGANPQIDWYCPRKTEASRPNYQGKRTVRAYFWQGIQTAHVKLMDVNPHYPNWCEYWNYLSDFSCPVDACGIVSFILHQDYFPVIVMMDDGEEVAVVRIVR